ncbi:MAG: DNA primase [Acidobacteriaceae bacterium]|nr:DNA primase [Acidobacteriaceae bacterium]
MNFAEHLKSQLNIVDVIGQYVRLKRQGTGRYAGLCPFHSEKTPSFSVHETLQFYKCFGCDAAGDVFKFVMEHDHLTFPEAMKVLAERYGIPMPERQRFDDPEAQRRAALLEMHEIAADVFQANLRGPAGKDARAYLQSRGVSDGSCAEFRLGLSDPSGQQLVQRLQRFGGSLMEESGLILKRQEGSGFFDRFRNRLMFPIHNESGKVIGFGGRALRSEDEPKYLNSPETAIYKKKMVLYNLHRAKIDARKQDRMILVEGYMDAIGVYSAGIHEVVASSGTALSTEQVRTIKRQISHQQANTGQIILNFDPDAAGVRSTEKYIGALLAEGVRVKVLRVPGGLDPDEYIQQHGADAYAKLLDGAESFFYWLAGRAREKFDMRTAEGRADAFKYISPALQHVADRVERGAIANELAEYLNVDRETIRENLGRSPAAQLPKKRSLPASVPPNEKLLLACLLSSHDARLAIKQYLLQSNMLHLLELKSIFEAVLAADEAGGGFSMERVSEQLDSRMGKILAELSFSDLAITEENAPQMALSCLSALEAKAWEKAREDIRRQIRELEGAGKLEEAFRLADELNKMKRASAGV